MDNVQNVSFYLLGCCDTLKMETLGTSETLANFHESTRRNTPEDVILEVLWDTAQCRLISRLHGCTFEEAVIFIPEESLLHSRRREK
jgi:hypothetical protein